MAMSPLLRLADEACRQLLDCAEQRCLSTVEENRVQECLDAVCEELSCQRKVTQRMKQTRRDLIKSTFDRFRCSGGASNGDNDVWTENKRCRYAAAPLVGDVATTVLQSASNSRSAVVGGLVDDDDESESWGVASWDLFKVDVNCKRFV